MKEHKTTFRMFLDFEKEETWLAKMSAAGWHLQKVSNSLYRFESGEPEKRVYKIDFRNFKDEKDFTDYVTLFADSGWKCIAPKKSAQNYYFYAREENPGKDIFSDKASQAQRYLRYAAYLSYTLVGLLPMYVALYVSGNLRPENLGYLTPGLWSMTGQEFVTHFLFETPFVIFRVFGGLFPLIVVGVGLLWLMGRYYRVYRKTLAAEER